MHDSDVESQCYYCLWCDPMTLQPPQCKDLRLWYKIVGVNSRWVWGHCGMCESCVALEWKEYRNDFKDLTDYVLKQRMEQQAYDAWHSELSRRVEALRVRNNIEESVELEFDGTGGKDRQIRKLRKEYFEKGALNDRPEINMDCDDDL